MQISFKFDYKFLAWQKEWSPSHQKLYNVEKESVSNNILNIVQKKDSFGDLG